MASQNIFSNFRDFSKTYLNHSDDNNDVYEFRDDERDCSTSTYSNNPSSSQNLSQNSCASTATASTAMLVDSDSEIPIQTSTPSTTVLEESGINFPFGLKKEAFEFLESVSTAGKRINTNIALITNGSEYTHMYEFNAKMKNGCETWRCNHHRKCKSRIYKLTNGKFVKCERKFIAHTHALSTKQLKKIKTRQAMKLVKEQCANLKHLVKDEGVQTVQQIYDSVMEQEE